MSYSSVRDYKGDIREFQAQRTTPVYEYIVRKFYCQENVVGNIKETDMTQLSWNIHTPNDNMVWKSVKLHIPMRITAQSNNENVSMRLSDRNPACNVALSACPMKMFTDCQLILNGSMFSVKPNFYESMLDTCYQSRDENSWMSSHSLKPNACRNLKRETEANGVFTVHDPQIAGAATFVQIHDGTSAVSSHAFDLTFANPGYNSRVRSFQTDLQGSTSYCDTEIVSYLHIGPFMRRVRKMPDGSKQYNSAVPFIKDFSLRLICDKAASQYDIQKGNRYDENFPGRVLPSSILEWATPCNMRHIGETEMPDVNWADKFDFVITSAPYLEVEYVKMPPQSLSNSYKLRALDYQHEKSEQFSFNFPLLDGTEDRLIAPPVPVRINSRLLEVCSKVYLWCELAQEYKKSFFLGGTQRCCKIDDLHLRINNRSDLLFEPTQLSLFDNFKKLTSNAWGLSTWEKSPIYCFDPASFGLEEYLTGQSQLMTYEWDMQVRPTELMIEEFLALEQQRVRKSIGYQEDIVFLPIHPNTYGFAHAFGNRVAEGNIRKYINWIPNPDNTAPDGAATTWAERKLLVPSANQWMSAHQSVVWMEFNIRRNTLNAEFQNQLLVQTHMGYPMQDVWTNALKNYVIKPSLQAFANSAEIWKIKKVTGHRLRFDGMAWALCDVEHLDGDGVQDFPLVATSTGGNGKLSILWFVPQSYPFSVSREDFQKQINDIYWGPKRLFNSINDYDFTANTWVAGKKPVWGLPEQPSTISNPGDGFITGHITQLVPDGTVVETLPFNSKVPLADSDTIPGIRAFPYTVAGGAHPTGIRNLADVDGGAHTGGNPAYAPRAGMRPVVNGVAGAGAAFMYNGQGPLDARNQAHYKWIAFQLHADAHDETNNNLNGKFIHSDGSAAQVTGSDVPRGDISFFEEQKDNNYIGEALGYETHLLQCVVERNVFNTRTVNAYVDYKKLPQDQGTSFGALARVGQEFGSSASASSTTAETNTLKFEVNVLYEMGQKNYVIQRDGKLEDYPEIQLNQNLVSGRKFPRDKRSSGYENDDARDFSALNQYKTQG